MHLNLERLDANGFDFDFSPDLAHERRVGLGSAKGLRGALTQSEESLRLTELVADSLIVSLLKLEFESFTVVLQEDGTLAAPHGTYERRSGHTELHLVAGALHAPKLAIEFQRFQVRGELRAENVRLNISGSQGRIQADSLEIRGLQLRSQLSGSVELGADRLKAKNVDVSWGNRGYSVKVGELELPKARLEADISASLGASEASPSKALPAPGSKSRAPIVEWNTLDGLAGTLNVDLFVDMSVPVIGTRKATHPFRVSIESGCLNYRDLESNLALLEDSLLDFSVREGDLVLELGIPLLPTRGHGKPLLIWPLSADDFALTAEKRVRLAVLPQWQLAPAEDSGQSESEGSGLALRELSFVDVQTSLRLEPKASNTTLRGLAFEELAIQGTVHHRSNGERLVGELAGKLRGLQTSVVGFQLGTSQLDLKLLELGELSNLNMQFQDVYPTNVTFDLADLRLTSLSIGT
jgi:hypothetical protein